eukprot:1159156-Pelagomonas_calceolata.AAC.21
MMVLLYDSGRCGWQHTAAQCSAVLCSADPALPGRHVPAMLLGSHTDLSDVPLNVGPHLFTRLPCTLVVCTQEPHGAQQCALRRGPPFARGTPKVQGRPAARCVLKPKQLAAFQRQGCKAWHGCAACPPQGNHGKHG